mgnify:CR=1 FL=1
METLRVLKSLTVMAGMKKPNDHAEPSMSNAKSTHTKLEILFRYYKD